uniref:FBA_2 domain-containing protein n=1 Tax=Steinernema glaseri TaxID=37863 RepID=A0A1I7ZZL7_9BILA
MDSLPLNFCTSVIAQLRFYPAENPLEGAGPMWSAASLALQRNRETISQAIIRPIFASSDWEYCFVGSKYHRLEDLLKRSRNMVQIVEVRFQYEREPHRSFFRISAEDLKTKLLPYVAGQVRTNAGFFCSLNSTPAIREHLSTFFSFFKDRQCFTTLNLNYQGPATEDFLRCQFNVSVYFVTVTLTGHDWPATAKAIVVDLLSHDQIEFLCLTAKHSNIALDAADLSMILHYWISERYPLRHKLSFALHKDGIAHFSDIRRDLQNPKKSNHSTGIAWNLKHSDGTSRRMSVGITTYNSTYLCIGVPNDLVPKTYVLESQTI